MFTKRNGHRFSWARLSVLAAILLAAGLRPNVATGATGPVFDSPEQAVAALHAAVKKDDLEAVSQLLGAIAVSGDSAQDKADRERFLQKYSQMRRLVKQSDGAAVLYIGAENWPFPVPLVSSGGKWRFDTDAGAQEILFRRIGEDEMSAIETCRGMARGASNPAAEGSHGYQFRVLKNADGTTVVAYPIEYGVTGIVTFGVTPEGAVYEKDLGPKTAEVAPAMTRFSPDRSWLVAKP